MDYIMQFFEDALYTFNAVTGQLAASDSPESFAAWLFSQHGTDNPIDRFMIGIGTISMLSLFLRIVIRRKKVPDQSTDS